MAAWQAARAVFSKHGLRFTDHFLGTAARILCCLLVAHQTMLFRVAADGRQEQHGGVSINIERDGRWLHRVHGLLLSSVVD